MKIYLASDHGAYELKETLKAFLAEEGHAVEDCGAHSYDAEDDYPDFVIPCARKVAEDAGSAGIVMGASGQGEAMAANRVPGARCAVYYGAPRGEQTDMDGKKLGMIASTREHNHANILSLGARFLSEDEAKEAVRDFLATPYSEAPRHARRVGKLG